MKPLNHRKLIACQHCDLLYAEPVLDIGHRARCVRCGSVLATRKLRVVDRMLATTLAIGVLMCAAVSFPFLSISEAGISRGISVLDTVRTLAQNGMEPLSLLAGSFIAAIPFARIAALLYLLTPIHLSGRAPRHAAQAFRLSEFLRPWAMAEVFLIGVAVSLVKINMLASIEFGTAFWAFTALVLISVFEIPFTCRRTIWKIIEFGAAR